ncbi:MAG: GNAT family N-acetyltransferase [Anaerolineaceae bacterium]|nr:GNAT family N-acetyltransferase [Anaerolineaceae bacterium]
MAAVPDKLLTTYLEMNSRNQFRPTFLDADAIADCNLMQLETVDLDYYRFLYRAVGAPWRWLYRLSISADELRAMLDKPGVTVDVLYVAGAPAGYVELSRVGPHTEIAYFGLRRAYFGRGLGKHLLSLGVQRAWNEGAGRVWLHTCNLDGPFAMANYQKRGFEIYMVEEEPMPDLYREGTTG